MVLAEAIGAGVPIVASESGAIPEVVGDAAVLVPPGDWLGLARALRRPAAARPIPRSPSVTPPTRRRSGSRPPTSGCSGERAGARGLLRPHAAAAARRGHRGHRHERPRRRRRRRSTARCCAPAGFENVTVTNITEGVDAEDAALRGRVLRPRDRQRGPPPLPLAAPRAAGALPGRRAVSRSRSRRATPRCCGSPTRRGRARRVRADGGRGERLRGGRRPGHGRPELRLPLDGARGREDDRLVCAARAPPDPVLPRARGAVLASST